MSGPESTAAIWHVPHERSDLSVGRASLIEEVHRRMNLGDRVQVLTGLGGVGKTHVATEFAHRYRDQYDLVWWVPALGQSSVLPAYERLAAQLGQRLSPRSAPAVAAEVLESALQGRRYLLVFDGAADPASIRPLLPRGTDGHILITSRHADWRGVGHTRPVRLLERHESIELLLDRTGLRDPEDADRIAQTLGDLPLALDQASAVIRQGGLSFTQYLRRYETQWASMLGEGLRPVDYPRSVAMTWGLAFQAVELASHAASDLLSLASFLDPARIPLALLREGDAKLPPNLRALAADGAAWSSALDVLLRYSLVEVDHAQSFSIHPLVATVTRDRMSDAGRAVWASTAIDVLSDAFRFDSANLATWGPSADLIPHIMEATVHAERLNVSPRATGHLLNEAGRLLLRRSQLTEAKGVLERAMRLFDGHLEEADPRRSAVANNLGRVYDHLGDNDRAIEFFEYALTVDRAAYGESHPHVAEVINNYAICLEKKGDFHTARTQFQWVADVYLQHYGPDHPKLATILNNLGQSLKRSNDHPAATERLQQALAIAERTLGVHHPTTARILCNMADLATGPDRWAVARDLVERALAIDEVALGNTNGVVAGDCDKLAEILGQLGELELARGYADRAAGIRSTVGTTV